MDPRDLLVLQPGKEAVFAAGRRTDHRDLLARPPVERRFHQTNDVLPDAWKGCQEQEDAKRSQHRHHTVLILSRALPQSGAAVSSPIRANGHWLSWAHFPSCPRQAGDRVPAS